ncbi:phage tail length tape measure family protein [Shimia thalassica]|uniref:phage tail length tape measure family protein n=1 Tax=Shimia thalassica TaxID=1715693 RepID=UPI0026E3D4D4|nr:phage tail length tape measure family protein [Shimia thalassica]MDO6480956.1 phage tail length tape measure family protein [Shimia thalassica]
MEGLERATDGSFQNIKKTLNVPAGGTTEKSLRAQATAAKTAGDAVKRMATATTNATTTATGQAAKLRAHFEAIGDASGIQRVEAALARLQSRAGKAGGTADLSAAKADYRGTITGLQAETRASQAAAKANAAHAKELVDLKTKFDPVFAVSNKYSQHLTELNEAKRLGVVNAQQYDAALERLNNQLAMGVVSSNKWGQSVRVSSAHMSAASANVVAQFNDIGVMLAAGQSPLLLAMQQGTQLSQVLNQMGGRGGVLAALKNGFIGMINPISLITIGAIAGGAALFQMFTGGSEKTKNFTASLSDARSALNELRSASDALAGGNLRQLRSEYGKVNDELDAHLERLQKVAQIEAATKNADLAASIRDAVTSDGNLLTGDVDAVRRAFDTTNDRARSFLYMLADIKNARTFEEQAAAITRLRKDVESTTGGLDKSEGAARGMLAQLIRAEDFALKLLAAMDGNTDATERSKGAAGGLTTSIGTAADEAARLLQTLGSIPSAFGMLDKSTGEQIASIQAQNDSLGIQLSEGLAAQAANRRVQLSDLVAAGTMTPDQAASEWAQIERLDGLLKRQEELRKNLSETGKTGGGSSKQIPEIVRTTASLEAQNIALNALKGGLFETQTAAEAYARAMIAGGGAVDQATMAALKQADAVAHANEQLRQIVQTNRSGGLQETTEQGIKSGLKSGLQAVMHGDAQGFAQSLADSVYISLSNAIADALTEQLFAKSAASTGGKWLSAIFGIFGAGSEGGYSESLPGKQAMPLAAFLNAPHYEEGTGNTSNGIPAVLHPNEAVVPLSRGRKIPVDMGNAGGKSVVVGDIVTNVQVEGDASAEDAAKIATHVSETVDGRIRTILAEEVAYGGILSPRGGM